MTSSNADKAKGRIKEAAGALTGDKDLKHDGRTDQAAANVKNIGDRAKEKLDETVDAVRDRLHRK